MSDQEIVRYVLKKKKNKKPGASFILASRHKRSKPLLYFDGETTRALRYAPNEQSIFEDEQSPNLVLEPIIFQDGKLDVLPHQLRLKEFLEHHPDNGKTFEKFDPAARAKEEARKLDLEDEALAVWRESSIDQRISLIRVLTEEAHPEKLSPDEIKVKSRSLAKSYPQKVLDTLKDPEFDKQNIAEIAFNDGWLTERKDGVFYNQKDNKKRAFVTTQDMDVITETIAWFKTEPGRELYQMIQKSEGK